MRPLQHITNNDVLGAPKGQTIEQCAALPITRSVYEDGTPAVVSYWEPTQEEIIQLLAGKLIRLTILGTTHAPVQIGVDGS